MKKVLQHDLETYQLEPNAVVRSSVFFCLIAIINLDAIPFEIQIMAQLILIKWQKDLDAQVG